MRVAVIIPTYNESGGISSLLDELRDVFRGMPHHDFFVVVVDASSPDGTADVVRKKSQIDKNIHLIVEDKKEGIAMAYIKGIRYAIDSLHADAFIEFDGDGQHDPRDISRMVKEFDNGYDYVVGSRYVEGGSVPSDWAAYRKFLSRFGSLYARFLLELPLKDITSGYKLTRVKNFGDTLPRSSNQLLSKHYAYKIQFLVAMLEKGARATEVPIVFRPRQYDTSKSTWRDIIESLRVTGTLRLRSLRRWRMFRVLGVGGVGLIIQTLIFETLGIWLKVVSPSTATLIGVECAIINNFFLNEHYNFRDAVNKDVPKYHRLLKFHLVSSGSLFTQWGCMFIAENLTHDPILLNVAFIVGAAIGFVFNYTGYYFFVWRKN